MDKEEADLRLRLIEVLLIIAGILVVFKQISDFLVPFFSVAILYFILISNRTNFKSQFYKFLFYLVTVFVAALFSASLGTVVGYITPGDLSFKSWLSVLYYVIFTILLFIALSEKNLPKKFISKIFQSNFMKKKIIKPFPMSDILAGMGIGLAYIFFGLHEAGGEIISRFWLGVITIILGSAILFLLIKLIIKDRNYYFFIKNKTEK